ncbi:MAG: hypothetical protein DWH99_15235 [Planctomycetota bacterium]|nr:MAG: hypothetical protein DWH99_15235 [Planctomycetota bacterium]
MSSFIRQNINPFGDYVDYESPVYVGTEIAGTIGSALANPTGFAAKGTAIYNLANKFDDAGRCANFVTKVVHGGCFIEGTLVTVSRLPGQSTSTDSLGSDPSWLDEPSQETPWLAPERYASVATRTQLQVPIESVPIGARVPTKNPNRVKVDPQPEPDQATWAKLSITDERSDGGIVDAELIRPRSWILANGICAGRLLPLNLPELDVYGLAMVTSIDDCPPIADGEGSVVTARFVTREVHVVASVDVLGADGTVETITGTTIHPVWSVDRQEWVPLAELAQGEGLCCDTESLGLGFHSSLPPQASGLVLSVSLSRVSQPVYNIEVHGEHVCQFESSFQTLLTQTGSYRREYLYNERTTNSATALLVCGSSPKASKTSVPVASTTTEYPAALVRISQVTDGSQRFPPFRYACHFELVGTEESQLRCRSLAAHWETAHRGPDVAPGDGADLALRQSLRDNSLEHDYNGSRWASMERHEISTEKIDWPELVRHVACERVVVELSELQRPIAMLVPAA